MEAMAPEAMDAFLASTARLAPRHAVAAVIVAPDGRYLLQLRDDKPEIFYPGHWALFGGAVEDGEDDLEAVAREVTEETGLALPPSRFSYFTRHDYDFSFGRGEEPKRRVFFEVAATAAELAGAKLGEGQAMGLFTPRQTLVELRVVPYDAFALWAHVARQRIG